MRTEQVTFRSEGVELAGLLRFPDTEEGRYRPIVQGPGWLGLKDGKAYERYHAALADAGFATLIFDYRGFGDSGGERGRISPSDQLTDLINAVTYITTRDDLDADNIGALGSGGTGGGNVFLLAHQDARIRAIVSQVPVADGRDWLHRMRPEHEWLSFLQALDDDRRSRVVHGQSRLVDPREEIMVATPERKQTTVKSDVDGRVPSKVAISCADEILRYRPIDAAASIDVPGMVIAVEHDATTPTDHALQLFEALRGPKQLVMQRHTSHYAAYETYGDQIAPAIASWFDEHLQRQGLEITRY